MEITTGMIVFFTKINFIVSSLEIRKLHFIALTSNNTVHNRTVTKSEATINHKFEVNKLLREMVTSRLVHIDCFAAEPLAQTHIYLVLSYL